MIFGSSVEIRTSHSFHAEGPSHCPIMSNEQRETHADVIIQYTTPRAHTLPGRIHSHGKKPMEYIRHTEGCC